MRARHREAESIEHRAEFGRRHVVVAVGRLDFLVTDSGDLREHTFEVGRHQIADRVELEAYSALPAALRGNDVAQRSSGERGRTVRSDVPDEFTSGACTRRDVIAAAEPPTVVRWDPSPSPPPA